MATRAIAVQQTQAQTQANLKKRHLTEKIAFGVLWAVAGLVIVVLFFVIFYLLMQAGKFFVGSENLLEDAVLIDSTAELYEYVATTPYSIGYTSFGELDGSTGVINLNDIAPTVANVENGDYLIQRTLYMLTPSTPEGAVETLLDYMRSSEGQQLVADQGLVPLEAAAAFAGGTEDLSGEITLAGSTTLQPLMESVIGVFSELYPNLTFTVEGGGSTVGIKAAGKANADIGLSSRDIKDYELKRYDDMEVFPIAQDGIAIIVHPDLVINTLSINQVRDIFTGNITNWSEVGGPDAPIEVVSRDTSSGTWYGFQNWILSKNLLIAHGFKTGDFGLVFQSLGASVKFIWRFLVTEPEPGMGGRGGISTTMVTTGYMVFWTLLIATPLGVGAAVYLVEYEGEMGGRSGVEVKTPAWARYAVIGAALLLFAALVFGGVTGQLGDVVSWLLIFALLAFILIGVFYGEGVPAWWVLGTIGVVTFVAGLAVPSVRMITDIAAVASIAAAALRLTKLLRPLVNIVGPSVVPVVRFAVETLAGVPSIIFGLFGFAFFVTAMHLQLSMISGALAGACLILPTIIRTTEEALLTVPRSYREASLAVGATKWQTNWQVVLPAALPGIVTGVILGVGRIVSETAVFYVTLGGSIHPPSSILALGDQGRTMVLHLYSLMMDANAPDPAMGTALMIIVIIVLINMGINYFSSRLARSLSGKA